mgnify:CR=1 FL=1
MKANHRFALILLPLGLAAALTAQTATPSDTEARGPRQGGRGHGPGPGHPIVRALDTNQDHEISASEIANASAALLALDADKNGSVTKEELHPTHPNRPADAPAGSRRPGPPEGAAGRTRPTDLVMLALDADGDGALSAGEISRASASIATLDADKDGKLVIDEVRPVPPEGAPHGGKMGPRGGRK